MAFVDIIQRPNGKFVVRRISDDMPETSTEFATRAEAEEWLIRNASFGDDEKIYKPGDGEGVA